MTAVRSRPRIDGPGATASTHPRWVGPGPAARMAPPFVGSGPTARMGPPFVGFRSPLAGFRQAITRKIRMGLTVALLTVVGLATSTAFAEERTVETVIERALDLLGDLELDAARTLLEHEVRAPRTPDAPTPLRARLWVLLGRARAEVGVFDGANDAFRRAVRLDPSVSLSPATSPKIRAQLEAARRAVVPSARLDRVAGSRGKDDVTDPADRRASATEDPALVPITHNVRRRSPASRRSNKRSFHHRIRGPVRLDAPVTIELVPRGWPKRTRFSAWGRTTPQGPYARIPMIATGTTTIIRPPMRRPTLFFYVEARDGTTVTPVHGTAITPIAIRTVPLPTINEAWSGDSSLTRTPTAAAAAPDDDDLTDIFIWVGVGVGVVIAATLVAVLLTRDNDDACIDPACGEAMMQPLIRF